MGQLVDQPFSQLASESSKQTLESEFNNNNKGQSVAQQDDIKCKQLKPIWGQLKVTSANDIKAQVQRLINSPRRLGFNLTSKYQISSRYGGLILLSIA